MIESKILQEDGHGEDWGGQQYLEARKGRKDEGNLLTGDV